MGIERYVLYLLAEDAYEALPLVWGGYEEAPTSRTVAHGHFAEVCVNGTPATMDVQDEDGLLAIVPMRYGGEVVAIIAVEQLLPHKEEWASIDSELFDVVSSLGATALVASGLCVEQRSPRSVLKSLLEPAGDKEALSVQADEGLVQGGER